MPPAQVLHHSRQTNTLVLDGFSEENGFKMKRSRTEQSTMLTAGCPPFPLDAPQPPAERHVPMMPRGS
eukprot:m.627679 g.627679  ORF g.627679 m.627679 type:complete len:68 (+) comp22561_c0_seq7:1316-1519(+)